MTKHPRWTRIHEYLMRTGASRQQASELYALLCMNDVTDTDTQERRVDEYLTRIAAGDTKIVAAGRAIEATG